MAAGRSRKWHQRHPDQKAYINAHCLKFVKDAKKQLARILSEPGHPQQMKDEVFDILQKEASLPGNSGALRLH